jgi:nucleotide-binding universal stress UspA family protein
MTADVTDPSREVIVVGVGLDADDDSPLRLAGELARVTGARLALVHAYPFDALIAVAPPRWAREMHEQTERALEALAAPLRSITDVSVQARPNPSPVRALHEAAEELGATMLVAGASHHHGIGRLAPGAVAERLLHAAPCAVAIVPSLSGEGPVALRRIGVAFVDGPEGAAALALAAELARRAGGRVRTLTVLEPLPTSAVVTPDGTPAPDLSELRRERVDAIAAKARAGIPDELLEAAHVLEGRAADALAHASEELDLLVCGSRGYGPVRSLLLGGVTSTLAHTTACPLLVVPRAVSG